MLTQLTIHVKYISTLHEHSKATQDFTYNLQIYSLSSLIYKSKMPTLVAYELYSITRFLEVPSLEYFTLTINLLLSNIFYVRSYDLIISRLELGKIFKY